MPESSRSALHALFVGTTVGMVVYLVLMIGDLTGVWDSLSAIDNAKAANDSPGLTALGVGGLFAATEWAKGLFDKTVGFPATGVKDMYDIASQDTPEAQADKAWEVYFDNIGIKNAPEGSPGGDIKDAAQRMQDFYKGKSGIP